MPRTRISLIQTVGYIYIQCDKWHEPRLHRRTVLRVFKIPDLYNKGMNDCDVCEKHQNFIAMPQNYEGAKVLFVVK